MKTLIKILLPICCLLFSETSYAQAQLNMLRSIYYEYKYSIHTDGSFYRGAYTEIKKMMPIIMDFCHSAGYAYNSRKDVDWKDEGWNEGLTYYYWTYENGWYVYGLSAGSGYNFFLIAEDGYELRLTWSYDNDRIDIYGPCK